MLGPTNVSVIIRTYNRVSMLRDALDSACGQLRRPGQILVVDDGSADDTPGLMAAYLAGHSNLQYVRLPVNQGMYRAAQVGFQQSTQPYVAFLDSDDIWLPEHLSVCITALEQNPALAMVYAKYGLVDEKGRLLVDQVAEASPSKPPLESFLLKRVVVQPTRTVYVRAAIAAVGGLPHHDVVGDWVLNVRIATRFPAGVQALEARTALFRIHDSQSYSRPGAVRDAFIEATTDLYRELPDLPVPRGRVLATSLLHCAIFFWQAGDSRGGWRCLLRAVREDPQICASGGFVAAAVRLLIPASLGRLGRRWKRALRRRASRDIQATAAGP